MYKPDVFPAQVTLLFSSRVFSWSDGESEAVAKRRERERERGVVQICGRNQKHNMRIKYIYGHILEYNDLFSPYLELIMLFFCL